MAQLSDVGVGVALYHLPTLCCPPLAWATFGEGRWRLEVNYLQSFRETEGQAIYFLDDVNGGNSSVQRANLFIESQHHASGLVLWRALGRSPGDGSLSILFGGAYVHSKQAGCFAPEGPVLSPEERSRCADYSRTYHHRILPQVGAVLDVPAGERLFVRATMRLFISLGVCAVETGQTSSAVPSINIRTIGELVSNRESFHAAKKVHRSTHSPGTRGLSRDGPKPQRQQ